FADRATDLGLEIQSTKHDADGNLVGLSGWSVGSPTDVEAKQAQLLRELGGTERTLRIGDRTFAVADPDREAIGTVSQALCSADLCTSDESFRTNLLFYRSIGSKTTVTSGGLELRRQTNKGQSHYECIDYPGPLPVTCRGYCDYAQGCPAGMTVG